MTTRKPRFNVGDYVYRSYSPTVLGRVTAVEPGLLTGRFNLTVEFTNGNVDENSPDMDYRSIQELIDTATKTLINHQTRLADAKEKLEPINDY